MQLGVKAGLDFSPSGILPILTFLAALLSLYPTEVNYTREPNSDTLEGAVIKLSVLLILGSGSECGRGCVEEVSLG